MGYFTVFTMLMLIIFAYTVSPSLKEARRRVNMDNYGGNSRSYVSIHVVFWPLILPVTQGCEIEPAFMEISFKFF